MDTNNWRPAQGGGGEPTMDTADWRSQLPSESRQRIVNKIMETLKRHLPFSGQEGLLELKKIAVRFEEKIYTAATSQSDYLRKISLKMLTMENKTQNTIAASTSNGSNPPDTGSQAIPSQIGNQGQSLPIQNNMANQIQARQPLLPQNMQNNMTAPGVQGSVSLASSLPPVVGVPPTSMANVVGQNSSLQNIQSMSGVSQSSAGNPLGQGVSSNMFAGTQRQMPGRQQQAVPQQQQQSQNQQHYLYQQQQQQQLLMKQKFQQGNMGHSQGQSHMQQQQQPQMQSSQPSVLQPSVMQPALSGIPSNHQSSVQQSSQSMIQPNSHSVHRQSQQQQPNSMIHQQSNMQQQPMLPVQQQQQLLGQQSNSANMQQNQLIGQQSSISDMQQQQQQQRLLGQQNSLSNLQQQQQLMSQQNNIPNMHQQQQLGPQSNVGGLQQRQQQQMIANHSGNSSMQTNQHSLNMLQQSKVPLQQQTQQGSATLLPNQGQQSEPQLSQQQLMSQAQSQPGQLQQQLGLQQQPNSLHREMQQRLQAPGSLLQPQNMTDQQKQLFQSQRAIQEASSTSLDSTAQTGNVNGGDWQEDVYQKIKAMKDAYLPELSEMYQKIAGKLQQHDSLPQQPKNEQLEKLKIFKTMMERIMAFLQVPKSSILPGYKDKLGSYEKQIVSFLNSNRPRKPVSSLQQGQQLAPSQMHPMQQPQQSQSQITQVQQHENQIQSMNLQSSAATVQQNNVTGLQQNTMSLSGPPNASQGMMNTMQPSSTADSSQGNALSTLQQVAVSSLQQNPVSASQQVNINPLSSQSGMNQLQPNLTAMQSTPNMLQQQNLKQQDHQMLQNHQLKQQLHQQRQMQQQIMHKQQLLQQQQQQQQQQQMHQQTKQLQNAQLQGNQIMQMHHMNDGNDMKLRQQMGVKSGAFQQHHTVNQRSAYHHQQLKPGAPYPISSPQLLQAPSPQMPQHPSPQIDQQNLLTSLTKAGTPFQSASSPFIVPSPSTPLAPSPMPGESEKVNSGVSALSNTGIIGNQQTAHSVNPAQSLAIGTPGISASPLLAEFSSPEGNQGHTSAVVSGKSILEKPMERLIKAVKSMSPQALSASVSDIGSVVSMIDRIAGSAPGNGSRAAVGEDLVAMTKCRLQARNFSQDGNNGTRKMRRYTSAMPLNVVSSAGSGNDNFKYFPGSETSDLESTATSNIKRPKIEGNHALLEEIREINHRLIDTVVGISDEDIDPTSAAGATTECSEGTVVKCTYSAVALSPNLKAQYASAQMSPIHPLRLLIPADYPNSSPVLLDKFPVEVSDEYEEDLSLKAKSRFSIHLRNLSQPMSLGEIARTWDVCTRAVICEYAQKSGGGSFTSKYGTWENCLSAA